MKSVTLTLKFGALMLAFVVAFASCKNDKAGSGEGQDASKQQSETADKREKSEIEYPLPTPYEVTNMLNESGASYVLALSNDVENVDQYFTEGQKALNLGIYGADLSYASTYNKTQETTDYLKATQQLTDQLDINTAINQRLMDRVEANINNTDSLHAIISESYYETFEFLNENGKGDISVMILAGGWIEGLYLSTHLVAENPDKIKEGVAEQKAILKELIGLLKNYKGQRELIDQTITDLGEIMAIYEAAGIDEKSKNFDEAEFEKLSKKMESIRNKIVG